ncbi:phytanoyl-CoA dioxygenase [Streptomyces carminius]|uniref:Phytanoyl-CoA dioxygenase n=1 Tax=Streptomyces carminius TaxID=2665496 RepID=A0A2M8LSH1_9ACTN|nr:phytanoyl-CoA dioxygenase family protein [Streptomyces carminius]PJE94894.1 phytanoyl-CoA dioxygenase [Streptomyces carminius]
MTLTVKGPRTWLGETDCDLADFRAHAGRTTVPADCPTAADIVRNVPLYDAEHLCRLAADPRGRRAIQAELARVLLDGPGIVVFKRAYPDPSVLDRAGAVFDALIEEERAAGTARGDHYAKPGTNDRVWNAVEKLAVRAPEVFTEYHADEMTALVCEAWLGPGYQLTSQVNVVNPGALAQCVHRDYHFGFLTDEHAAAFPAHMHRAAPVLTLQGAVAHCDMPVETGPTMYLPHSQTYEPGYLAWRRPEFRAYFEEHHVQLPLDKGDAVFFSPALFHAAGHNSTADVRRMANLLQISSPFGRSMETVDRERMVNAVFPVLLRRRAEGAPERWLRNVVAACAEGYSFPTNLDLDAPVGGLAPPAPAELVWRALERGASPGELRRELRAAAERRLSRGQATDAGGATP